jgi:hypothetical protein
MEDNIPRFLFVGVQYDPWTTPPSIVITSINLLGVLSLISNFCDFGIHIWVIYTFELH